VRRQTSTLDALSGGLKAAVPRTVMEWSQNTPSARRRRQAGWLVPMASSALILRQEDCVATRCCNSEKRNRTDRECPRCERIQLNESLLAGAPAVLESSIQLCCTKPLQLHAQFSALSLLKSQTMPGGKISMISNDGETSSDSEASATRRISRACNS
jgi:hypothetical protein